MFRFLRILSLISEDQKKNIICTTDIVRGDVLRRPHGTTPAAIIEYTKLKGDLVRAVIISVRKKIDHTVVSVSKTSPATL